MGGTPLFYYVTGDDIEDAFRGLRNVLHVDIEDKTWPDPFHKPGFVQVWESPVQPEDIKILAKRILYGLVPGNQWSDAEAASNLTKFGPWYVIQVATEPGGGLAPNHCWLFFGWVNT